MYRVRNPRMASGSSGTSRRPDRKYWLPMREDFTLNKNWCLSFPLGRDSIGFAYRAAEPLGVVSKFRQAELEME
jgi:hypothetical protein